MKTLAAGVLAALWICTSAVPAAAHRAAWVSGQDMGSPFMRVYGEALPPIGYIGFCKRHSADCRAQAATAPAEVALTTARAKQLNDINTLVNGLIAPATDMDTYGVLERWEYPSHQGDCEDYVLLKQRMLIARGWPEPSLLITVVRDENGEGHAVLTVRTSTGDLLLDNKRDEIVTWNRSGYSFIKRQSFANPNVWRELSPPRDGGAVATSAQGRH